MENKPKVKSLLGVNGVSKLFLVSLFVGLSYFIVYYSGFFRGWFLFNPTGLLGQDYSKVDYYFLYLGGVFETILTVAFAHRILKFIQKKHTNSWLVFKEVSGRKALFWSLIYTVIIIHSISSIFFYSLSVEKNRQQQNNISLTFRIAGTNTTIDGQVHLNDKVLGNTKKGRLDIDKNEWESGTIKFHPTDTKDFIIKYQVSQLGKDENTVRLWINPEKLPKSYLK